MFPNKHLQIQNLPLNLKSPFKFKSQLKFKNFLAQKAQNNKKFSKFLFQSIFLWELKQDLKKIKRLKAKFKTSNNNLIF